MCDEAIVMMFMSGDTSSLERGGWALHIHDQQLSSQAGIVLTGSFLFAEARERREEKWRRVLVPPQKI